MYYHRINKITNEYYGDTDVLDDDPDCIYVLQDDYPLPFSDVFTQKIFWSVDNWIVMERVTG
jgi:hypothetical protein